MGRSRGWRWRRDWGRWKRRASYRAATMRTRWHTSDGGDNKLQAATMRLSQVQALSLRVHFPFKLSLSLSLSLSSGFQFVKLGLKINGMCKWFYNWRAKLYCQRKWFSVCLSFTCAPKHASGWNIFQISFSPETNTVVASHIFSQTKRWEYRKIGDYFLVCLS